MDLTFYISFNPVATVALPIRNMKDIGWLALESLCHQQTAHQWELIIIQEKEGHDWFDVTPYETRLEGAGCVRIIRIDLDDTVRLADKWILAGQQAHPSSEVFILQAGDCYSPPDRIDLAIDAIRSGADWHDQVNGVFYYIQKQKLIVYNGALKQSLTNLNMSFATHYARTIPKTHLKKGIDGFLFYHCQSSKLKLKRRDLIINRRKDVVLSGIDTHGHNTISMRRLQFFQTIKPPFQSCQITLDDMNMPLDIIERLKSMSDL